MAVSGYPEAQAMGIFHNSINKDLRQHLSCNIIYDQECRSKMRGTYEPEEILFNILERSNIIATIKFVLFLCLQIHHAFRVRTLQWYKSFGEVMKLSSMSLY